MDATAWAAVATGLSALVIAWQSFETRRSAGQAKRSADASEEAVGAAVDALDLTRQQAKHSQLMAAEAIRARMEVQGPAITVRFADPDGPKAHSYALAPTSDAETPMIIRPGYELWDPRNGDDWLYAVVSISFENTSPHPVTIICPNLFSHQSEGKMVSRIPRLLIPAPRPETPMIISAQLLVGTTVANWLRATKQQNRGTLVGGSAHWSTELTGETGVQVTNEIQILGSIIESFKENGGYRLREIGPDVNYPSRFLVQPQRREYFIGQDRDGTRHKLPPIEPEIIKD